MDTGHDGEVQGASLEQIAWQGGDVFCEDGSFQAPRRGFKIDRRQKLRLGDMDLLRRRFRPVHGGGEIRPVGEQLYRKMRRERNPRWNADRFSSE